MKPYNKLSKFDKELIVESYYNNKQFTFKDIAHNLNVSERSVSRVLFEKNINTKRKNRYTVNEDYFNEIDSERKAYILGLIYADGYVGDDKHNNLVISNNDKELLDAIKQEINFTGEVLKTKKGGFKNSKEGYVLRFSSESLVNNLRKQGLYPNKSLTICQLPKIDRKLYRHFIRGYFDGDGSISISTKTSYYKSLHGVIKYEYKSFVFSIIGTEKFLNCVGDYLPKVNWKLYKSKTDEMKYLKICAARSIDELFNFLYKDATICLKVKYNKWLTIKSAFAK